MTFPNLPGKQYRNTRASLERACEEMDWYLRALKRDWLHIALAVKTLYSNWTANLKHEIENATPETASELYKQARQLCLDIEKILSECSKKN